jgi:prephenate dehydratase
MKIAYLGPQGTFTEKAAREMFPEGTFNPCPLVKLHEARPRGI